MWYVVKGVQALALAVVGIALVIGLSGEDEKTAIAAELKIAAAGGVLFAVARLAERKFFPS